MKKMKLFLLASLVVGVASAFTTSRSSDELLVLNKAGTGYITETEAIEQGGSCNHNFVEEKCTYIEPGVPNPLGEDGRYQYP